MVTSLLLERKAFELARIFASANGQATSSITLAEIGDILSSVSQSSLWSYEDTRCAVWSDISKVMLRQGCDARVAADYFYNLITTGTINGLLLSNIELHHLCDLALQWYNGSRTGCTPLKDADFLMVCKHILGFL